MQGKLSRIVVSLSVCVALGNVVIPNAMAMDLVKTQSENSLSYQQEAAGNLMGAIKTTLGTLAREPQYYEATLRLGYLYNRAGATTDAVETYKKGIALRGEAVEPRLGLMQVFMAQGKWDDLIKVGMTVLKIDPNHYGTLSQMAWAAYSKKDYTEAQNRYKQILTLYPADLEMKIGLAWAVLKSGDKKTAEQLFAEILTVSPGNPRGLTGWKEARGG